MNQNKHQVSESSQSQIPKLQLEGSLQHGKHSTDHKRSLLSRVFCRIRTIAHALLSPGTLIAVVSRVVPSSAVASVGTNTNQPTSQQTEPTSTRGSSLLNSQRSTYTCTHSRIRAHAYVRTRTVSSVVALATFLVVVLLPLFAPTQNQTNPSPLPTIPLISQLLPQSAKAQTPNTTVNFQARILTSTGALVPDGNYHIEFKLYDSIASGASAQGVCSLNSSTDDCWWLETRTTGNLVRVVNGYISVNLGSVTAMGSSIPWSQDLYVTMRVGGSAGAASWDTEMTNTGNRMKLSAVPLALVSNNVRTANRTAAASDSIVIKTGTTTTSGNSGNISIDVGTAAGTAGVVDLGGANASALNLGRAGAQTTINGSSILLNSATLQRTAAGTTNLNLIDGANTTLSLTNSGAGNLNLTVDGTINTNTQGASIFTFSGANPVISASTAATGLTVQAPTTGTLTLNTVGAGTVNIGTANTTVIGLGSASSTTTVLGITNINATGATATTIGNSGSNLTIGGILQGTNTTGLTFEGTTANGFETTLAVVDPTVGDQIFQLPNAAAAGTYQICTTTNNCGSLTGYIQNQSASDQSASFRVAGTGAVNFTSTTALTVRNTASATTTLIVDSTNQRVGIGSSTAPTSTLYVEKYGTSDLYVTNIQSSSASTSTQTTLNASNTVSPGSASTAFYYGGKINIASSSANLTGGGIIGLENQAAFSATGSILYSYGADSYSYNVSTGTINNAFGVQSRIYNQTIGSIGTAYASNSFVQNASTGVITTANGYHTKLINAGTVTTSYGLEVENPQNTGAIGTARGVALGDLSTASGTITNRTNLLIGTGTTGNWSIYNSSNYTNLFQGSIVANNSATGTTGTAEAVARTNVTTVTTTAIVGGFANNDIIFLNNAGQDYYTRIVSGAGTTALVVSPAVSYDASITITEYQNVTNLGATQSDYTTQTQRFFQGYFLGGVVTGAGSTTLSDGNLTSTGALNLRTGGNNTRVNITSGGNIGIGTSGTPAQLLSVGGTTGNLTVDTAGALVSTSTVRSNTGFNFNGTAGLTQSCTGGQTSTNEVIQGGIVTSNTCSAAGTGTITGSGTTNQVAYFSGASAITSGAALTYNGGQLAVNNTSATSQNSFNVFANNASNISNAVNIRNYTGEGLVIQPYDAVDRAAISVRNSAGGYLAEWRMTGEFRGRDASIGYSYLSDSDTGVGRTGANALSVYTGNVARISVDASGNTSMSGNLSLTASTATLSIADAGHAAGANMLAVGDDTYFGDADATGTLGLYSSSNAANGILAFGNGGKSIGNSSSSYGALSVYGSTNGWNGINFSGSATLMVSGDTVGFYNTAVSGWNWYWSGGTLTVGTVPYANLSGVGTLATQSRTSSSGVTIANGGSGAPIGPEILGSGGGAAALTFHRPGAFAAHFGIDTDSIWRVGGWSMGNASYRVLLGDAYNNTTTIMTTGQISSGQLVNSDATVYGAGQVCRSALGFGTYVYAHCASLRQYKDDIVDLPYGLDTIRQIRPVKYKWNVDTMDYDIGFIAEEIAAVNPIFGEYQGDASTPLTGVKYNHLTALLASGIQELDVQVQSHEARLSVLESGTFSGNLHVFGDTVLNGNLAIAGTTSLVDMVVTGDTAVQTLTVNGKIITAGATPTIVLGAQATGQGAVTAIAGNDTAGNISYTAGIQNLPTNPLSSGEQVSVMYVTSFTQAPRIALTAKDADSATIRYFVETTTAGFVVHFIDTPAPGATYTFDYIVIQ